MVSSYFVASKTDSKNSKNHITVSQIFDLNVIKDINQRRFFFNKFSCTDYSSDPWAQFNERYI